MANSPSLPDMDEFARRYFDFHRILKSGTREERLAMLPTDDRPSDCLLDHLRTSVGAERAWPVILGLLERAPDEEAVAFVAAGPLEDLIHDYGEQFADRLVNRARQDARFRQALAGVWGWEDVSASLRSRVSELRRTR